MFKISIVGTQVNSGFRSEIEFWSETDILDQTVVNLIETDNYEPIAAEVEYYEVD